MSWSDRILEVLGDGSRSPAGDQWELYYSGLVNGVTRYASSRVHQNVESEEVTVRARVVVGSKVGTATTSDMRPEGVRAVLRRAYQVAKSSPEDEAFPGLPGPRPANKNRGAKLFARSTDETTAAARAERVNLILKRLDGDSLGAAGLVSTRTDRHAILNSEGLSDASRSTTSCIRVFAIEPSGSSGYAGRIHRDIDALDPATIASTAARKAVRGRDPLPVEPGDWDVLLEPAAVSELLEWLSFGSFGARSLEDGSSLLAGRIGSRVTSEKITIRTTDQDVGFGAPADVFDAEGVMRRAVPILEKGVAMGVVHDIGTAARASGNENIVTSTGHAEADGLWSGPQVRHLEMLPGKSTFAEMVSKVERGLWVTRFHYVNGLLDTRNARMTGMTRDGTFLIQDGKITRGVANLRFTDNFLDAFDRVEAVTAERRVIPTWWSEGGAHIVPGLLMRRLHFSG